MSRSRKGAGIGISSKSMDYTNGHSFKGSGSRFVSRIPLPDKGNPEPYMISKNSRSYSNDSDLLTEDLDHISIVPEEEDEDGIREDDDGDDLDSPDEPVNYCRPGYQYETEADDEAPESEREFPKPKFTYPNSTPRDKYHQKRKQLGPVHIYRSTPVYVSMQRNINQAL